MDSKQILRGISKEKKSFFFLLCYYCMTNSTTSKPKKAQVTHVKSFSDAIFTSKCYSIYYLEVEKVDNFIQFCLFGKSMHEIFTYSYDCKSLCFSKNMFTCYSANSEGTFCPDQAQRFLAM